MSLNQIMKLGEVLELTWKEVTVKTKLQDIIIKDSSVLVFQPTIRGIPLRILDGQVVKFSFCRDNGRYIFNGLIERTFESEGIKLSRFKVKGEIIKKQLRNFFRLHVGLDAMVKFFEPELDISKLTDAYKVRVNNLSQGGLLFSSKEYFSVGTILNISLNLDGYNNISSSAKVMRCVPPKDNNDKNKTSIQFFNLSTREQTILNKFILKKQISDRKRV